MHNDEEERNKYVLSMDIYFITQVFPFVHDGTNKLHCSLSAVNNIHNPSEALDNPETIMRLSFSLALILGE
jgi:hypothetical protein